MKRYWMMVCLVGMAVAIPSVAAADETANAPSDSGPDECLSLASDYDGTPWFDRVLNKALVEKETDRGVMIRVYLPGGVIGGAAAWGSSYVMFSSSCSLLRIVTCALMEELTAESLVACVHG